MFYDNLSFAVNIEEGVVDLDILLLFQLINLFVDESMDVLGEAVHLFVHWHIGGG